jgi:hypothetical protein
MTVGTPREAMSGTTIRHAIPAPSRSAKYSLPMPSGRRPNNVAMMTPAGRKEANNARHSTRRRKTLRRPSPL